MWHSGQPLRPESMQEAELPHGFSEERKNRGKITFIQDMARHKCKRHQEVKPVYLQLLHEQRMRKDTLRLAGNANDAARTFDLLLPDLLKGPEGW